MVGTDLLALNIGDVLLDKPSLHNLTTHALQRINEDKWREAVVAGDLEWSDQFAAMDSTLQDTFLVCE